MQDDGKGIQTHDARSELTTYYSPGGSKADGSPMMPQGYWALVKLEPGMLRINGPFDTREEAEGCGSRSA
jgi:hypothetical protein